MLSSKILYDEQGENHPGCCPVCGKRLVSLEMLPPANPRLPIFCL